MEITFRTALGIFADWSHRLRPIGMQRIIIIILLWYWSIGWCMDQLLEDTDDMSLDEMLQSSAKLITQLLNFEISSCWKYLFYCLQNLKIISFINFIVLSISKLLSHFDEMFLFFFLLKEILMLQFSRISQCCRFQGSIFL